MSVPGKAAAKETARVGLLGLAIYAGVQLIARVLEHNATGALGAQFVLAEAGLGKLGVAWSDPHAPIATTRQIAARAMKGARYGATVAAAGIAIGLATRTLTRDNAPPSLSPLLLGTLVAAASAARDELLLRGLPLRLIEPLRASLGKHASAAGLLLVAAAGVAARFGTPDASAPELIFAGASAVALGGVWLRDRGVWMAWGANAAFAMLAGPLVRGGLVDLRAARGELVTSVPMLAVVVSIAAASAWSALRPRAAATG